MKVMGPMCVVCYEDWSAEGIDYGSQPVRATVVYDGISVCAKHYNLARWGNERGKPVLDPTMFEGKEPTRGALEAATPVGPLDDDQALDNEVRLYQRDTSFIQTGLPVRTKQEQQPVSAPDDPSIDPPDGLKVNNPKPWRLLKASTGTTWLGNMDAASDRLLYNETLHLLGLNKVQCVSMDFATREEALAANGTTERRWTDVAEEIKVLADEANTKHGSDADLHQMQPGDQGVLSDTCTVCGKTRAQIIGMQTVPWHRCSARNSEDKQCLAPYGHSARHMFYGATPANLAEDEHLMGEAETLTYHYDRTTGLEQESPFPNGPFTQPTEDGGTEHAHNPLAENCRLRTDSAFMHGTICTVCTFEAERNGNWLSEPVRAICVCRDSNNEGPLKPPGKDRYDPSGLHYRYCALYEMEPDVCEADTAINQQHDWQPLHGGRTFTSIKDSSDAVVYEGCTACGEERSVPVTPVVSKAYDSLKGIQT